MRRPYEDLPAKLKAYTKLRSKKYSVQVRDRVSKSPCPPFSKGGRGDFSLPDLSHMFPL